MKLDREDIKHIAGLARLELTDEEISQYASELSVVFDYFNMLDEVEVETVEETTQVTGLMNVTRPDTPEPISSEARDALLNAFPQRNGELLTVKAVFDNNEDA